ncbi:hypothetical protein WJX84_004263 [Apatococcus fuscideae]|uniref:Succinyl-CoA:3-ketoacid-coenzyme A transferase n=1 Tax=Apatococcus fuscideae TaxID=2026836 RepID=A0AAW1S5U7_9CHLO
MQDCTAWRLRVISGQLASTSKRSAEGVVGQPCRAEAAGSSSRICSREEALDLIQDGDSLVVAGFVGCGSPEHLLRGLRAKYDATSHPSNLDVYVGAPGGKGRGVELLAAEGLLRSLTYGWLGLSPKLLELVMKGKAKAWNFPLGIMSHLFRDVAAKRPGPISHVGLGTFVDPREKGGKVGGAHQRDKVRLMDVGGRDMLWYEAPRRIHIALLRGTSADLDGNISYEREPLLVDNLNQAFAAHNSGGKVIVQVERIVDRGSFPQRLIHIPGALVDKVVVAPVEDHWPTMASPVYDGSLTGEVRAPSSSTRPLAFSPKRIMAHRAMLELTKPHSIVNLGIGAPEGVSVMVATHGDAVSRTCHLTTEAGVIGGSPVGGLLFGAARNATALMPAASIIDFYQGGGCDLAVLGMAEVDAVGNVNVSNFGPGCGGFIDISQTSKQVIFLGTFTSGGLEVDIKHGKLTIVKEGRVEKFRKNVREKTFGAATAGERSIILNKATICFGLAIPYLQVVSHGGLGNKRLMLH